MQAESAKWRQCFGIIFLTTELANIFLYKNTSHYSLIGTQKVTAMATTNIMNTWEILSYNYINDWKDKLLWIGIWITISSCLELVGLPFCLRVFQIYNWEKKNQKLEWNSQGLQKKIQHLHSWLCDPPPYLVGFYSFISVDYILNKAEGISFIQRIF